MSTERTLGPWEARFDSDEDVVYVTADMAGTHDVCDLYHIAGGITFTKDNAVANAHLIAAAPELLETLKDCVSVMEAELKGLAVIQPELKSARAAIAKAEGKS